MQSGSPSPSESGSDPESGPDPPSNVTAHPHVPVELALVAFQGHASTPGIVVLFTYNAFAGSSKELLVASLIAGAGPDGTAHSLNFVLVPYPSASKSKYHSTSPGVVHCEYEAPTKDPDTIIRISLMR